MKLRLLVLTIFALLLTLIVPVTADASAGGDDWWQQKCPDGFDGPDKDGNCTRVTEEIFDAEKIVHYYCEAPYTGPNKDNQCAKLNVETFPADEIAEYRCPAGYDGPVDKSCTKTVTTTETVHVNEETTKICPDGWALTGVAPDTCAFGVIEIVTSPPTTIDEYSCPATYAGPDANNKCTRVSIAIDTKPAVTTTDEVCPEGFTLQSANCVKRVDQQQYIGATSTVTLTCAAELSFETAGCVAKVPAKTVYSCEAGFTIDETTFPATCVQNSNEGPLVITLECPAPLINLVVVMPGMGLCDSVSAPQNITTLACPGTFTPVAGSDTLCEKTINGGVSVPPITVTTVACDADYAGPDANGECTKTTFDDDVVDATVTTSQVCTAPDIGPDANGDCVGILSTNIFTPVIELPSFTCPAGYDGPDDAWNCSKDITEVKTVDAERVVTGYDCPDDSRGPNKDNLCARDSIENVDAKEEISYICPKDTHGAKDGKCVRKTVEVVPAFGNSCTVKFYDYPHAQKFLFAESEEGAKSLDGKLAVFNNDVESIKVPNGCDASMAQKLDGSGWCMTFGPGVHNLPDDQLSWYSIPGTGCKN